MAKRLPQDRHDAEIIRLASEGAILNEIRLAIGETCDFVYRRLHKLGMPPLASKGERLLSRVRELAADGLTLAEISKSVGRSYAHIAQIASEGGVDITRAPNTGGNQEFKCDHSEVIALLQQGVTGIEVARRLGVTRQRICQIAQKSGVPMKRGRLDPALRAEIANSRLGASESLRQRGANPAEPIRSGGDQHRSSVAATHSGRPA